MSRIEHKNTLILRAFSDVRESYVDSTALNVTGLDVESGIATARRMAQILHDTLPPAGRETVIIAGILLCRANGVFNDPPPEGAFDAYGPGVAALMLDIQLNPSHPRMDPYIDKRILHIYTAYQIARDETGLRTGPAALNEAYVLLGDLRQRRIERDRDPWRDLGAPRLQALELETTSRLTRVIESWIRQNDQTAAPARPGMYRPN